MNPADARRQILESMAKLIGSTIAAEHPDVYFDHDLSEEDSAAALEALRGIRVDLLRMASRRTA